MNIAQRKIQIVKNYINSKNLDRKVEVDLFIPQNYLIYSSLPTLILNDGQDSKQLHLNECLLNSIIKHSETPLVVIAVYANDARLHEYGTTNFPDYKNRGNLAKNYAKFIIEELIPYYKKSYSMLLKPTITYFAGFSLGGLSAFDIASENPTMFSKIGVFSGSFWWRSKAYEDGYEDKDRIAHKKVESVYPKENHLKYWFECGTNDEESDRNNSGIIDSIEDTLDLISCLKEFRNKKDADIEYVEIEGGEHNFTTWSAVFPRFIEWIYK